MNEMGSILNLFLLVQIILGTQIKYTFLVKDDFSFSKREKVKIKLPKNEILDIDFYSSNFPDIISKYFFFTQRVYETQKF